MEGESKRTVLLTVRYAAAGIGRQALNFLLFAVWCITFRRATSAYWPSW